MSIKTMSIRRRAAHALAVCCASLGVTAALSLSSLGVTPAKAFVISFEASDFGLNPTFSNVQTFAFSIDIAAPLTAGATYNNPLLNGVNYNVSGTLGATPSGFPGFNLVRAISGTDFYSQGSELSFGISAIADLSDGLQVSELVGVAPVFLFDGREVGTGRYHPALFRLNADGTGSIRNSNNFGGINPGSNAFVNVQYGEEYITELTFDASQLTLADAPEIPEPSAGLPLLLLGFLGIRTLRRRHRRTPMSDLPSTPAG